MGARAYATKGTKNQNQTLKRHSEGRYRRISEAGTTSLAYGVPVPERLHDAIESERDNLSKAESLLGCLAIAMEYPSDLDSAPYYPDVAQVARELVKKSISGLDPLVLQQRLCNKVKEESGLSFVRPEHVIPLLGVRLSYKASVLRLHRRVTRNYGRARLSNDASAVSASAKICG